MRMRRRTNSSPGPAAGSQPFSSPLPIPRSNTAGGFGKQTPSRKSPSPTHYGAAAAARKQRGGTPSKPSVGKSPTSSPSPCKGGIQESSPVTQKQVAQFIPKGSPAPLTAAAQAINEQVKGSDMTAGLNQPAFAGFSNTSANKELARPATRTIRRALSNIEPLVCRPPDNSPILTALARQSNGGMGVPITDLSEPGAEDKQIIRVHSSPAILAMGLPRKGSLLTAPGFQLGTGASSPMFRRHSGGGYTPLKGKSPPLSSSPTGLPTIPGSPTKTSHSKDFKDAAVDQDQEMRPLKGLFIVGSSSPRTGENGILFGTHSGRLSENSNRNTGEKPAVVSQGKS